MPLPSEYQQTSDYSDHARAARDFYRRVLVALGEGGVPALVGGAYAYARFTGIRRETKDFDLFVRPDDFTKALRVLAEAGFETEATFPHWLGKASEGKNLVDIIFGSGNGAAPVDDEWIAHAIPSEIMALPVLLAPPEEMLWSKSFVMERERYDGADVIHLMHARGPHLDWDRLLRRFGDYWRVLYSYLVLYGFIYPGEPLPCPRAVMDELTGRLMAELDRPPSREKLCRGTLVSREQYLVDTRERGYLDGRQEPSGTMTAEEIANWTEEIWRDHPPH